MPHSTVKRVDCMVCEQYNSKTLRAKSTLLTECSPLAGRTNGDRRPNGEWIIFDGASATSGEPGRNGRTVRR